MVARLLAGVVAIGLILWALSNLATPELESRAPAAPIDATDPHGPPVEPDASPPAPDDAAASERPLLPAAAKPPPEERDAKKEGKGHEREDEEVEEDEREGDEGSG